MALRDALVKDHPAVPGYQRGLGESLLRSGQARRDQGDVAGAAADWKRADGLLEGAGPLNLEFTIIHACCHASLFWAAGQPASDVPAREAGTEADRAIALLQHAVDLGCRDLSTYHNETALDPLRGRDDFRTLMLNIAFPAKPFAAVRSRQASDKTFPAAGQETPPDIATGLALFQTHAVRNLRVSSCAILRRRATMLPASMPEAPTRAARQHTACSCSGRS